MKGKVDTPTQPNFEPCLDTNKATTTTPLAIIGDQILRMVPMIVGRAEPTEVEEKISKHKKIQLITYELVAN